MKRTSLILSLEGEGSLMLAGFLTASVRTNHQSNFNYSFKLK